MVYVRAAMQGGYRRAMSTMTRPANATQYDALDAIADTAPSTSQVFSNAARKNGGSGALLDARVTTSNLSWTNAITLVVYESPPAAFVEDNAAFDEKWVDDEKIVCEILFPAFSTITGGVGAIRRSEVGGIHKQFICAEDSRDLYYQAYVPSGSPTPASAQPFTFRLGILQD